MGKLSPTDCIASDFDTKWYKKWAGIIGYPKGKHPKFWETAAIAELISNAGHLKQGKTGLGMGVGTEPLASLFAKFGVMVTATDQSPVHEKSNKWDNGQLAHNKQSLYYPTILSKKQFNKNVSYRPYDMNKDEKSFYNKYDFIWHNCVIGHLGSLENSIRQLKLSEKYLKEGGRLVFTTELNISSLDKTILDNSDTVIWRFSDLERLFKEMANIGMIADRFNLRLGTSSHDTRINYNHIKNVYQSSSNLLDDSDYSEIKIPFSNYAITQIVLSFKKSNKINKHITRHYERDTLKNIETLKRHLDINKDLKDYYDQQDEIELFDAELTPEQKVIHIEMEPNTLGKIDLRFLNKSNLRLFDYSFVTPLGKSPLVLGTYNPVNRDSIFATKDWSSPNRPSVTFSIQKIHKNPDWNEHRVDTGEWFEYSFPVKSPKKPGEYTESYCLIFEGKAIPLSSVVTIKIIVRPKKSKRKDNRILDIKGYFKKSGLSKIIPSKIQNSFEDWVNIIAKREFRYRYCIGTVEFSSLLSSYITGYFPDFKYNKELVSDIARKNKYFIQINHKSLHPSLRARLVLQISNPRVGGTLFNELLGDITGWPALQGGTDKYAVDYNAIGGPLIMHMHTPAEELDRNKIPLPYQVVTLARDPIDTLISGFMFVQKNPTIDWLNRRVFPSVVKWRDLKPNSKEFLKWATSKGAEAMLSVTKSWWYTADARVKYEEYKSNPVEAIGAVLKVIDSSNEYHATTILNTVTKLDKSFLTKTSNRHRWDGGIGYSTKYLSAHSIEKIRQYHASTISALGY